MKFAFVGTPAFAAHVLRHLFELGRMPTMVVSQVARPQGRGRRLVEPPAVVAARSLQFEQIQVADINAQSVVDVLRGLGVEALVVASFGQIFRGPLLDCFLCLNVHASLLPLYRGAAPIERCIAAGEQQTGVSIMRMSQGLDEGPYALRKTISIDERDDAGSVARLLALAGAEGIHQVLDGLAEGTVAWTEQSGGGTYAAKITARDLALDPSCHAAAVHNQVRSLSPHIGAQAAVDGLDFKVWRTWPFESGVRSLPPGAAAVAGSAGEMCVAERRLFMGCRKGAVEFLSIQPAGKKSMGAGDFLRGYGSRVEGRRISPPGYEEWC